LYFAVEKRKEEENVCGKKFMASTVEPAWWTIRWKLVQDSRRNNVTTLLLFCLYCSHGAQKASNVFFNEAFD
jgi:hypothetical protein